MAIEATQAKPHPAPGISEDQFLEAFRDPHWRLAHLYSIPPATGR